MTSEEPTTRLGIEVFAAPQREAAPGRDSSSSWLTPASGGSAARRMALIGQEAVDAAIAALAGSISRVANGVVSELSQNDQSATSASQLRSVELTFGVKVTAGSGKLIEAFVTAGGEATVQVKVVLEPTPRP